MILSNLKKICAAYHKVATSALTVDTVDLFLVAANNVRSNAELLHNFELSRVQATLSIDGSNGGALSTATILGGTTYLITQVQVIGTLSPDATDNYTRYGTINNKSFFIGDTKAYVIVYITDAWYIMPLSAGYQTTNAWKFTSVSNSPAGVYTPQGTATGTATVLLETTSETTSFASIKEIIAVSRSTADGFLLPLDFTRADIAIERDRYEREMSDEWEPMNRYPSDAQTLSRGANGTVVQRGGTLYVYPVPEDSTTDFDVTLECYGKLADYTAGNLSDTVPTDFFIEYGSTYMQWAIICELNYLFQTFVPRQEGVLSPPEQARETAWRNLILWDTYQVDSNATRSR